MAQSVRLATPLMLLICTLLSPHSESKDNLWQHIADSKVIATPTHKRVQSKLVRFEKQAFFANSVALRAKPYLFHIVSELKARNLPLELALLPVIESDYRMTTSYRGAAGIWQLMPTIAQHYNVPINAHFDGRFDLRLSTHAALDYLSALYKEFNQDWLLALAAYNCGEGVVKKAIASNRRQHQPTDFWHLTLPSETQDYVPKFLALTQLLRTNPDYFAAISNQPETREVDVEQAFSLLVIAELLNLPSTEIIKYNPAFIADRSSEQGPFHLLLPNKLATTLEQVLLFSRYGKEKGYTVKKGDSLYRLAALTNSSVAKLKSLNRLKSNTIYLGQQLILPASSKTMPNLMREYAISPYLKRMQPELETLEVTYHVKANDSLWHIATLFDVTTKQLRTWNKLENPRFIKPGQAIKVVITQNKSSKSNLIVENHLTHLIPYFSMTQTTNLSN